VSWLRFVDEKNTIKILENLDPEQQRKTICRDIAVLESMYIYTYLHKNIIANLL
jgi:hypothetical protein